jgi:hypothetical protein
MKAPTSATLFCLVFAAFGVASARPKYADWARNQVTGAPLPGASVEVFLAGTTTHATLFTGAGGSLSNPFQASTQAGNLGYFEFYAEQGSYDIIVDLLGDSQPPYTIPRVQLVDPNGPQRVCSDAAIPALTTSQVAADAPCFYDTCVPLNDNTAWSQLSTVHFWFDRRTSSGALDSAPWLLVGYRAEQGIAHEYNTFGRYGFVPIVPGPVGEPLGSNTADAGNFGDSYFGIDWHGGGLLQTGEFGVWIRGDSADVVSNVSTAVSVDMPVEGVSPVPFDVVALSTSGAVTRVTTGGARAPFVVTSLQNGRATVAVAGVAWVRAAGPITVGDALATSTSAGFAAKAPGGTPPSSVVGTALDPLPGATGIIRVRVGMVAP